MCAADFATKLYYLFYLLLTSWDTVQLEHEVQHKIIPSDFGKNSKWNVEQNMGCISLIISSVDV